MNAFPEILNHLFISVVFSHLYSAITSWLYLTPSPWKLIRIQTELVEVVAFVGASGTESRLGYFNQLWSQTENRTSALGELKEMEMKRSQRSLCLFITGVAQLSCALCQLQGIFLGVLQQELARRRRLQHWQLLIEHTHGEGACERSSKEIFSPRPFNFD